MTVGLALLAFAEAATHRALLVGVGDYAPETGWVDLASRNDVAALRGVLGRWGFADADVQVLLDRDATRDGVVHALASLEQRAATGDHLLVTWSGHGQQIADDDGDEADGYDEALVPVDAPMRPAEGYDGSRHLRDDDLGEALERLRTKVGPAGSVTIFLDACHSGTATRGSLPTRGGAPPIGRPKTTAPRVPVAGSDFVTSGGGDASFVVLSAARADQPARETFADDGQPIGALTRALVETLSADRPLPTWAAVYEQVRAEMAGTVAGQTPQLEGDRDRGLFDGTQSSPDPYFVVGSVLGARKVRLDAGALHGLTVGTELAFFPPGTARPTPGLQPLATGVVATATATAATVDLAADAAEAAIRPARAFVSRWALGELALPIRLSLGRGADRWIAAIEASPKLRAEPAAPEVVLAELGDEVVLTEAADPARVLARSPRSAEPAGSDVMAALLARSHTRLVRAVRLDGAAYAVEARLATTSRGCPEVATRTAIVPDAAGLHVAVGHSVRLDLRNVGTTQAFVTLVLVNPDGSADQVSPRQGEAPVALPPGGPEWLAACFDVVPPLGTVEVKVFATRTPIDLGPVLGYAGTTRGGAAAGPLQRLLEDAASGTRGLVSTATVADGFTTSLVLDVVE